MRGKNLKNVAMVVDDDLFVRQIVRSSLVDFLEVVEVSDGAEVLIQYMNNLPDILFLDIHLPHISGMELLAKIKDFDPDAYIIMLSADSSIENVVKTKEYGVAGFLTKPFAKNRLMSVLHTCPTVKFTD